MPRRRFRSFRRTGAAKQRKFQWSRTNYVLGAAAASDKVDLLANLRADLGTAANLPDWTAVRVRGVVQFALPAATAPDVETGVILGTIVDNRSIGIPPDPVSQPYLDWQVYQPIMAGEHSGYLPGNNGLIFTGIVDNKAMRRLHELDDTLWMSWKLIDAADTFTARGVFSVGFKLP